jgi:hypothetical protein
MKKMKALKHEGSYTDSLITLWEKSGRYLVYLLT